MDQLSVDNTDPTCAAEQQLLLPQLLMSNDKKGQDRISRFRSFPWLSLVRPRVKSNLI